MLILISQFLLHPAAVPLWGILSFFIVQGLTALNNRRKNSIEQKKLDVTENLGERQSTREEFAVIKDTLYKELERLKTTQEETSKQLEEANEETKKCEERYFELATQYRELLKYCATLARKVRLLEAKVTAHVSEENNNNNEQNGTHPETTGTTDE